MESDFRQGVSSSLRQVRGVMMLLGASHLFVLFLAAFLISETSRLCRPRYLLPFLAVSLSALLRLFLMLQTARAQRSAASLILHSPSDPHPSSSANSLLRIQRRVSYKTWLRWTRCTLVVVLLQFLCAGYLLIKSPDYFSITTQHAESHSDDDCDLGRVEMELLLVEAEIAVFLHDLGVFGRCCAVFCRT